MNTLFINSFGICYYYYFFNVNFQNFTHKVDSEFKPINDFGKSSLKSECGI